MAAAITTIQGRGVRLASWLAPVKCAVDEKVDLIVRGHGTADMPAWGDAFKKTKGTETKTVEDAIRNLAEYLRSLQRPAK
jgi:hypothetical protein